MNAGPAHPLRLTFLIGSLEVGGAERQLIRLVNELDRSRFRPSIVVWFGGGALSAELRDDVPVIHLALKQVGAAGPLLRPLLVLRLLARLVACVRAQQPDVLVAYMFLAYVVGAIAGRIARVPVIVAARRGLVSYRTYGRQWRIAARLADRFIELYLCNSEAVRQWAIDKEGISRARTQVVYNGIDLPPARDVALPAEWRAGAGVLAVMVANLIHYKAHDTLLEAVARVRARHSDFRLVLIGDGPERERLEMLSAGLGVEQAVVFAGRDPRAPELLPGFDLALLTSTEEGFPNALMEAMANGLPVVATAVGGTRELVRDGVDGLLVPPRDAEALAAAIGDLIEDPGRRRMMGAAGREWIAERFGVRRMVEETESALEGLLARRAPVAAMAGWR